MLLNCVIEEGEQPGCIFFRNIYQRKISVNVIAFASYGNGTHVNSLEGYYATTTPTVLAYSDSYGRKDYEVSPFWSKVFLRNFIQTSISAHYWNRTHMNSLERYYAPTTPMMLLHSQKEKGEQHGCAHFCNKYHRKFSINVMASASYGNRTNINKLGGYYATTAPTMLCYWNSDDR